MPALSADNRRALDCWRAIGEFSLAEALLWADLQDVEDPEDLVARLVVIREAVSAQP
jgi:hypothetical protein